MKSNTQNKQDIQKKTYSISSAISNSIKSVLSSLSTEFNQSTYSSFLMLNPPVCTPSAAVLVKLVVKVIVHPRVVRHSFCCLSPCVEFFFIDRPFGYRQFFARRRGSQVRGHKPRNWSGILREYPFWRQNAEGCRQNSRPIATAFLGVVPGLPTFVPRIS